MLNMHPKWICLHYKVTSGALNGYILINQSLPTGAGAVRIGLLRLSNMWDFQSCKLSVFCRFFAVRDTRRSNNKNTCVFCKGHLANKSAPARHHPLKVCISENKSEPLQSLNVAGVQLQDYRRITPPPPHPPQKRSREQTILIMWAWENAHGGGAEKVTLT